MESIEVTARFDKSGKIWPMRFVWQGREIQVEAVGRRWARDGAQHILVMALGGQVFELVFQNDTATWWIQVPGTKPTVV
jgi:hypothetical protein